MTIKRMRNGRMGWSQRRDGHQRNGHAPVMRLVSGLAVVLMVALLLAACGGSKNKAQPTKTPIPAAHASTPAPKSSVSAPAVVVTGASPAAATPPPGAASPAAAQAASGTPKPSNSAGAASAGIPTVTGCSEPKSLPPAKTTTLYITDDQVNLRKGPGTDCDVIQSMDKGTQVKALSGPVQNAKFQWVKVDVDGTEGWVAAEFAGPNKPSAGGTVTPGASTTP